MKSISVEQALKLENVVFIDTRTPSEFKQAHIPGAINIPLFTDDERALIGTIYHRESKEKAMDLGIRIFGERLQEYIGLYAKFKSRKMVIYCWRGGMRSKAITSFLDSIGYDVYQLEGGHKAFRNYVVNRLKNFDLRPKLIVLYGKTGANKTKLVQQLRPSIDLEGLAQHRSSLFGAVGLKPTSQKMFEALFLFELEKLNKEKYLFVEGESRKIGDIIIPEFFFKAMQKATKIKIECPVFHRAKNILVEYFDSEDKIKQVRQVIPSLKKFLGMKKVEYLLSLIDKGDFLGVTKTLLVDYYDIKYRHTVDSFEYALTVDSSDLESARRSIENFTSSFAQHFEGWC